MSIPLYYPLADSKIQNFVGKYPGRAIKPNVLVLHTMEVNGWPGYGGGNSAPHLSLVTKQNSDGSLKSFSWRQHFPFTRSARALLNKSGGVETNNSSQGVIQVELGGTCGWASRVTPNWSIDSALFNVAKPLVDFLVFANEHLGIELVAPYPFVPYNSKIRRMTYTEWMKFQGICGHQHVPENSHVDPGAINIKWLIDQAKKTIENKLPPAPKPPEASKPPYIPHKIDVNGKFDRATIMATQHLTGLVGRQIDGVWGPISKKQLQKWLIVKRDGIVGKDTVKALQTRVGVPKPHRDGIWGPETTTYLQKYLNNRLGGV